MDRYTKESHPVYTVKEAYVHGPETEITSVTELTYLNEIYYGLTGNTLQHLKFGFDRFQRASLDGRGNLNITTSKNRWFYNRQTMTQIFFDFTSQKEEERPKEVKTDLEEIEQEGPAKKIPRTIPLRRNINPFHELQMDLLYYTSGMEQGDSGKKRKKPKIVLAVIDPGTRVGFARPIPSKKTESIAHALCEMIPSEIQELVEVLRSDDGSEFSPQKLEPLLKKNGWHFNPNFEQKRVNKAGRMLSGSDSSPSTMAPVETFIRTLRELIEYYKRAGSSADGKLSLFGANRVVTFQGLVNIYNQTTHSAFDNKFSPQDMVEPKNASIYEHFIDKNNSRREVGIEAIGDNVLKDGEYVRVIKKREAMTKAALPTLSTDVYQVNLRQKDPDVINVHLTRIDQKGRPPYPPRHNPGREIVVHHTKIARIKTLNHTHGATLDPPEWSKWHVYLEKFRNDKSVTPGNINTADTEYNVN